MTRYLPSLILGVLALLLDRAHKFIQIELQGWRGGEMVRVNELFDYVLVWNTGISYGLLGSVPVWMLGVLISGAIVGLAIWWLRAETALVRAGLALAIGGALSNGIDRVLYGAVADFFHFHWQDWSFYIFNVADVAISLGVLLLVLDFLGIGRGRPRERIAA